MATKKNISESEKAPIKEAKIKSKKTPGIKTKAKPVKVNVYEAKKEKIKKEVLPKRAETVKEIKEEKKSFSLPFNIEKQEKENKEEQPKSELKKESLNARSLGIYRKIAWSFVVLTLGLLALIFYFSFTKVSINITPQRERIADTVVLDIYDKEKVTDTEDKIVGAVRKLEMSESKTYPSSGSELVGSDVTGKVTIVNNYSKSQPLVASTRLLTPDNKLFRLKETVSVPAGGSVEAEVYADQPSADMEIAKGTRMTIPGLWAGIQDKIYAETKEIIKYQAKEKKYIAQADIDSGIADLKKVLMEKAKKEFGEENNYDRIVFGLDENTLSVEVGGKIKEEKSEFPISMKADIVIIAFNEDKILPLAEEKLISSLPDDKEMVEFDREKIVYVLNNYDVNQGIASLTLSFEGMAILKEGADIIDRNKLIGLNKEQIENYLDSLPEINGYGVTFFPSFVNKAPNLVDRIIINIIK